MLFIVTLLIMWFIPLSIFIWAVFMLKAGSYTFIALYIAFQAYIFLINSSKPRPIRAEWSSDEIEIIQRYHLALRYPIGAKMMSILLNGFRWVGLLLFTPLLLWNHMWIAATLVIIGFIISGPISLRLDPFPFLSDAVARGKLQLADDLELLEQVSQKLRDSSRKTMSSK